MTRHTTSPFFPLLPPVRRRSKRLQKKLHIGEFQEQGFPVRFRLAPSSTPQEQDAFWSAFIGDVIEARGLAFGGGEDGYVVKAGRGSATPDDRAAVARWLDERADVEHVEVGALQDAWCGPAQVDRSRA